MGKASEQKCYFSSPRHLSTCRQVVLRHGITLCVFQVEVRVSFQSHLRIISRRPSYTFTFLDLKSKNHSRKKNKRTEDGHATVGSIVNESSRSRGGCMTVDLKYRALMRLEPCQQFFFYNRRLPLYKKFGSSSSPCVRKCYP